MLRRIFIGRTEQRIAIAGAIAMQTHCLVLDEPTAMLESAREGRGAGRCKKTARRTWDDYCLHHTFYGGSDCSRAYRIDGRRTYCHGWNAAEHFFHRRSVFGRLGLDIPLAADLAQRLRQGGYDLPQDILTDEELVQCLSR